MGFEINYPETINIDYEEDFDYFTYVTETEKIALIGIDKRAYQIE
jgi:hypothetical protein